MISTSYRSKDRPDAQKEEEQTPYPVLPLSAYLGSPVHAKYAPGSHFLEVTDLIKNNEVLSRHRFVESSTILLFSERSIETNFRK